MKTGLLTLATAMVVVAAQTETVPVALTALVDPLNVEGVDTTGLVAVQPVLIGGEPNHTTVHSTTLTLNDPTPIKTTSEDLKAEVTVRSTHPYIANNEAIYDSKEAPENRLVDEPGSLVFDLVIGDEDIMTDMQLIFETKTDYKVSELSGCYDEDGNEYTLSKIEGEREIIEDGESKIEKVNRYTVTLDKVEEKPETKEEEKDKVEEKVTEEDKEGEKVEEEDVTEKETEKETVKETEKETDDKKEEKEDTNAILIEKTSTHKLVCYHNGVSAISPDDDKMTVFLKNKGETTAVSVKESPQSFTLETKVLEDFYNSVVVEETKGDNTSTTTTTRAIELPAQPEEGDYQIDIKYIESGLAPIEVNTCSIVLGDDTKTELEEGYSNVHDGVVSILVKDTHFKQGVIKFECKEVYKDIDVAAVDIRIYKLSEGKLEEAVDALHTAAVNSVVDAVNNKLAEKKEDKKEDKKDDKKEEKKDEKEVTTENTEDSKKTENGEEVEKEDSPVTETVEILNSLEYQGYFLALVDVDNVQLDGVRVTIEVPVLLEPAQVLRITSEINKSLDSQQSTKGKVVLSSIDHAPLEKTEGYTYVIDYFINTVTDNTNKDKDGSTPEKSEPTTTPINHANVMVSTLKMLKAVEFKDDTNAIITVTSADAKIDLNKACFDEINNKAVEGDFNCGGNCDIMCDSGKRCFDNYDCASYTCVRPSYFAPGACAGPDTVIPVKNQNNASPSLSLTTTAVFAVLSGVVAYAFL